MLRKFRTLFKLLRNLERLPQIELQLQELKAQSATTSALAPALDALGWAWGPTGGAGFALASGLPVLHAQSDLDLVVRMPQAPSAEQRDHLVRALSNAECRIDLQIDTGHGGFALRDWLTSPRQTMLKTDQGPRLVADPWSACA